ncbi:polysaccharide biosynthesis/export family protein, partial [Planctomycetota bacterium]
WSLSSTLITNASSLLQTSPVANGVPAHMVPDDLLAESKERLKQIPPTWLKGPDQGDYKLDTGDILAVLIYETLPKGNQILPVNFPDSSSLPPTTGVPIPIRDDGSISLPHIGSINLRGLTESEAEQKIIEAYIDEGKVLNEDAKTQISVSLARPRQIRVLVVRDDSPGQRSQHEDPGFRLFGSSQLGNRRGSGFGNELQMPHNEADLITALAETGGFPGPNGTNEVFIYRGLSTFGDYDVPTDWNADRPAQKDRSNGPSTVRIPLRIDADVTERPFSPEDVRLYPDDIVYVPARTTDVYYTGGLLPAREVPLPRDYDVRALEAVLRVGGSVVNGGRFTNNFTGGILTQGIGTPSPTLLTVIRKVPGGGQVNIRVDLSKALTDSNENLLIKEGDVLLLQETPSEAVARYLSQTFSINGATQIFSRGSAAASGAAGLP